MIVVLRATLESNFEIMLLRWCLTHDQLVLLFCRIKLPFSILMDVNWIFLNKCNSPLHSLNLILWAK